MSFKVLVIPEDSTNNGYILKPLVQRLLEECGKSRARITILSSPRAQGYEHVKGLMPEIIDRWGHIDLLLFLPDRDGKDKIAELRIIEQNATNAGARLLCCAAEQEVEVWLLAGHRQVLAQGWTDVRSNPSVKEEIFEPFLVVNGNPDAAGKGREQLMNRTLENFAGLLSLCPELNELKTRIQALLADQDPK